MGLVESWGTGIRKIIDSAKEYDLPQPEFIEMPETFRVNLYRKDTRTDNNTRNEMKIYGISETGMKKSNTGTEIEPEVLKTGTEIQETSTEISNASTETSTKTSNTSTENKIISMIAENPGITIMEMAERTGMSKNGVIYSIDKLRKKNIISREGAQKNGKWIIKK